MAINQSEGPAIIIAASGMCNAGRIKHHLKHHLWRPDSHIVFIGYQAQGTVGRQIVDGAKTVRIFGEPVAVRAKVHTLGGFSAHADREELLDWARHIRTPGLRVFVVHGEEKSALALAEALRGCGLSWVEVPRLLDSFELKETVPATPTPPAEPIQPIETLMALERRVRRLRKRLSRRRGSWTGRGDSFMHRAHELQALLAEMEASMEQQRG